jgi:hypothetical protein
MVAGAVALLLLAAPAVAQGPPQSGSGEGMITDFDITPVREAGGNRFEDRVLTGFVTGDLEGSFVEHVSGMVHKSGRVVFSGTMTFTGTVGDCGEGTITLGLTGRGEVVEPGFPVTEAQVRVIDQSSNDVAVTGTGTVSQEGPSLTYDISYVCR